MIKTWDVLQCASLRWRITNMAELVAQSLANAVEHEINYKFWNPQYVGKLM